MISSHASRRQSLTFIQPQTVGDTSVMSSINTLNAFWHHWIFFFFFNRKTSLRTLAFLSLFNRIQQSQNLPQRKTTHIQTVFCCFKPKKTSFKSLSFGLTRIKQTEPISSYSLTALSQSALNLATFLAQHIIQVLFTVPLYFFLQVSQT